MLLRTLFDLLGTAAKIAAIFVAIVSVFLFARDGSPAAPIQASAEEQVVEAPHKPRRVLSAFAAPTGGTGILRR